MTDTQRFTAIRRVLWQVLALNLLVAVAKLIYGALTGAISMVADGLHSLLDSSSNVIGLFGTAAAARPPDHGHPFGHRKFEVLGALGIAFLLGLACFEILRGSIERLMSGGAPRVTPWSFAIMAGTMAINAWVSAYEKRRGDRLRSPILVADSLHTRSDIFASAAVLVGLLGARLKVPWLDPVAALLIVGFILWAGYQIVSSALDILADARVYHPDDIAGVIMQVDGVLECHDIRTRGLPDHVHLDFHMVVAPGTPTHEAHEIAHRVMERVQGRFPQIRDVTPHVEPPEEYRKRGCT